MKTDWIKKIKEERQRQISGKGYTAEHDDTHKHGKIADHAAALATTWLNCVDTIYPYSDEAIKMGLKKQDRETQLIKAGALIIAELERLERLTRRH